MRKNVYVELLAFGLILSLSAVLLSCKNPFSHRSSEPPIGSSGTYEVPSTPQIVLTNLLYAYNEKNINNFRKCLSDSFIFSAYEDSVEAEQRGEGWVFYDWNADVEEAITRRIFQSYPLNSDSTEMSLIIDLSSNPLDQENDSTATLIRTYNLLIINFTEETAETTTAIGESSFNLSRSSLIGWSIDLWSDRPDENNDFDWADFKALYR